MKRLVLLGEGHGEVSALPILVSKFLDEKDTARRFFVDKEVIRRSPSELVKWDKSDNRADHSKWISTLGIAARRREVGGVLAVYDGDARMFPGGSTFPFCAGSVAKAMATAAVAVGASEKFSLSVVFACSEYESWIIAGLDSLRGKKLLDGRIAIPANVSFPAGDSESHGKRWLERNLPNYRPTRDQADLTALLSLEAVRSKNLRSFRRLEHAIDELLAAVDSGKHISTPA